MDHPAKIIEQFLVPYGPQEASVYLLDSNRVVLE